MIHHPVAFGVLHIIVAFGIWLAVVYFGILSIGIDERGNHESGIESPNRDTQTQDFRESRTAESASKVRADEILSKYWGSLVFVGVAIALGSSARYWVVRSHIANSSLNNVSCVSEAAKTGLTCGGLAVGTLAASTAIIQATVADEMRLPSGASQVEVIVWLAFLLVYIVILAAYIGALDQIRKRP